MFLNVCMGAGVPGGPPGGSEGGSGALPVLFDPVGLYRKLDFQNFYKRKYIEKHMAQDPSINFKMEALK